jgi:hypothetical protein
MNVKNVLMVIGKKIQHIAHSHKKTAKNIILKMENVLIAIWDGDFVKENVLSVLKKPKILNAQYGMRKGTASNAMVDIISVKISMKVANYKKRIAMDMKKSEVTARTATGDIYSEKEIVLS